MRFNSGFKGLRQAIKFFVVDGCKCIDF